VNKCDYISRDNPSDEFKAKKGGKCGWSDLSVFPQNPYGWSIFEGRELKSVSQDYVEKTAEKWSPLSKVIFGSPSTNLLLPPILVPELENQMQRRTCRSLLIMFVVSLFGFLLFFISFSGLFIHEKKNIPAVAFMSLITAFFWIEYISAKRDTAVISERVLYICWLNRSLNKYIYSIPAILIVLGVLQFCVDAIQVENNYLVLKYGIVYLAIDNGEYWRFLIGPFLHSSPQHWFGNMLMVIIFLPMMSPFKRSLYQMTLFYLATVLSSMGVYLYRSYYVTAAIGPDGFAGISGGIFYLQGFLLANVLVYRESYPKGFVFAMAVLVLVNLLAPLLYQNNTSFVAHLIGFILGLTIGGLFKPSCT
jgi:membrane associated rhomboid family serine protease